MRIKTIKQIADELGISKQRVYRFIKSNNIKEAYQKHDTNYYDDVAEKLLIKHFEVETVSSELHQNHVNDTTVDAVIEMLKKELDTKNMQIENQQKIIIEQSQSIQDLTSALSRQQALHAGTIQQQLLEGSSDPIETEEKKSSFFERIFNKKQHSK